MQTEKSNSPALAVTLGHVERLNQLLGLSEPVKMFKISFKKRGTILLVGYYKKKVAAGSGPDFETALTRFENSIRNHDLMA